MPKVSKIEHWLYSESYELTLLKVFLIILAQTWTNEENKRLFTSYKTNAIAKIVRN